VTVQSKRQGILGYNVNGILGCFRDRVTLGVCGNGEPVFVENPAVRLHAEYVNELELAVRTEIVAVHFAGAGELAEPGTEDQVADIFIFSCLMGYCCAA